MPTQIRKSAFETNSSSTHSVSVCEDDDIFMLENLPLDNDGNLLLEGGQFGWEHKYYYDALTKTNYIAIYLKLYYPEHDMIQTFENIIKEQTGAKNIFYLIKEDESYIDHQSCESKDYHHLFKNSKLLRNFIFHPRSYLETDNDNRGGGYDDYDDTEA